MANAFTDTDITGTLTVNGEEISGPSVVFALQAALSLAGKGTGIIASDGAPELKVSATSSPSMAVDIAPGAAMIAGVGAGTNGSTTDDMVAPVTNPRIDRVQFSVADGVNIKTGTENVSPTAPTEDADNISLATIYHRVGETSIEDADDATNGYITDTRSA
jgi:hypothetical protein